MDGSTRTQGVIVVSADDFQHGPTTVWQRPDGSTYTVGPSLYEFTVVGEEARVVHADAVRETWGASVPDFADRVLGLGVGEEATIFDLPRIVVRRIQ